MRVKITFSSNENFFVPFNYKYEISALIYKLIAKASQDYATFLHEKGFEFDFLRKFKLFTFSDLNFLPFKIDKTKGGFCEVEKVELIFSTLIPESIEKFISGIFKKQQIFLGFSKGKKIDLFVEDVRALLEPNFDNELRFKCLSPIVVTTKKEINGDLKLHFVEYDSPDEKKQFADNIHKNLLYKYAAFHSKKYENQDYIFEFHFDEDYIKSRNRKVYKLLRYKNTNIKGVYAPGLIKAPKELLEILYFGGVGEKNSSGFGCVEKV